MATSCRSSGRFPRGTIAGACLQPSKPSTAYNFDRVGAIPEPVDAVFEDADEAHLGSIANGITRGRASDASASCDFRQRHGRLAMIHHCTGDHRKHREFADSKGLSQARRNDAVLSEPSPAKPAGCPLLQGNSRTAMTGASLRPNRSHHCADRHPPVLDHRSEIFHFLVGDQSFAVQHPGRFRAFVDLLVRVRCEQARQ